MMQHVNQRHGLSYRVRKFFFIFFTILTSGNRSAWYVFWIKFLQVVCLPLDYLFFLMEKIFLKQQGGKDLPMVCVVGIHRTGSTMVSQFLADTFPFFPIGNFSTLFRKSSFIPYRLAIPFYRQGRKKSYRNYYGISTGLFAIGDAYEFWDQWLGRDHYTAGGLTDPSKAESLKRHFANIYRACHRPLITKNNRNSLMIDDFYRLFPNAFFIVVEREALSVIRSTVKASRDFFGMGNLWGLLPDEMFDPDSFENMQEAATVQYLELKRKIGVQLQNLPEENYVKVSYEEFCRNPEHVQQHILEKLGSKYGISSRNVVFKDPSISSSTRLENSEVDEQIRYYLDKWTNLYPDHMA
ncbi:MAG: sulfotransferase [Bacteroidales bacterium]|nr:sulfotransferase [Bacteroidales bacterium]